MIKPFIPLLVCLVLALSEAAGGDFSRTFSPEEMKSTGLTKLTPEELAQLEAKVELYKTNAIAAQSALPPSTPKSLFPSWLGALATLERVGRQPDKSDAMDCQLAGEFSGWTGQTSFRLTNGQIWTQINSDSYPYSPALLSPKAKIYPATFGSFWLEIEGVNQRCRVKPARLQ